MDETDSYIDGIFNYCDRWCERCCFTSRCRLFGTSQERVLTDEVAPKPGTAAFWQALGRSFERTQRKLGETAARRRIDLETLELPEAEADDAGPPRRRTRSHPLVRAAEAYTWKAHAWLKEHEAPAVRDGDARRPSPRDGAATGDAELPSLDEALDVVGWFHMQIAVKLHRAVSQEGDEEAESWDDPFEELDGEDTAEIDTGGVWQEDDPDWTDGSDLEDPSASWGEEWHPDDDEEDEEFTDEELRAMDEYDRDGSAKVALIGIDHSLAAWGALGEHMAGEAETIFEMLVRLARLGRAVEAEFPRARAFIRPGFDE